MRPTRVSDVMPHVFATGVVAVALTAHVANGTETVIGEAIIATGSTWVICEVVNEQQATAEEFAGRSTSVGLRVGIVACNTATGGRQYLRVPRRDHVDGTSADTLSAVQWSDGCVALAPLEGRFVGKRVEARPATQELWLWRPGALPKCTHHDGRFGDARDLITALDGSGFSVDYVCRSNEGEVAQTVARIREKAKWPSTYFALPIESRNREMGLLSPFRSVVLGWGGRSIVEHVCAVDGDSVLRRRELDVGCPVQWAISISDIKKNIGREFLELAIPGQCSGPTPMIPVVVGDASHADIWMLDVDTGNFTGPVGFPMRSAFLAPVCTRTGTLLADTGHRRDKRQPTVRIYDTKSAKYVYDDVISVEDGGRLLPVGFLPDNSLVLRSIACLWKLDYPFSGTPRLILNLRSAHEPDFH